MEPCESESLRTDEDGLAGDGLRELVDQTTVILGAGDTQVQTRSSGEICDEPAEEHLRTGEGAAVGIRKNADHAFGRDAGKEFEATRRRRHR